MRMSVEWRIDLEEDEDDEVVVLMFLSYVWKGIVGSLSFYVSLLLWCWDGEVVGTQGSQTVGDQNSSPINDAPNQTPRHFNRRT